jgi:HSP20 family molecular chaperone IbpA
VPHDDYTREYTTRFPQIARGSRGDVHVPNADLYVAPDQSRVVVDMELAGIDQDSLTVAADAQNLTVAGRRIPPGQLPNGDCLLKEIEYGEFERNIHLPLK